MKKTITTLLIVLIIVALGAGAVLLRKHRMAAVNDLDTIGEIPWALHVAEIQRGALSKGFPVLASLSGSTVITISSQISGTLESMGPREGVKVAQGDVLARISVAELEQLKAGLQEQRQAVQAEQNRTRDEYARQRALQKKGLTTQEVVEAEHAAAIAARQQVASLDKQLAGMDVRVGYGTVYAPQDALVEARLAEVGDVAQPGKPLYKLTVDSAARLRVNLPQQILEQVQPGTRVELRYGSQQQAVSLSRIFPALDAHALGTAEADLKAMPFDLPSGARIPARVILASVEDVISVPHRALVRTGDQGFLFKVTGSGDKLQLKRVSVNISLDARDGLAVEGDLQPGDRVVVAHQSVLMQLRDGDPVEIRSTASDEAQQ